MAVVILLRASGNSRHNAHDRIGFNNSLFLLEIPDVIVINKNIDEIGHLSVGIDKVPLQGRIRGSQGLDYFHHGVTGDLYL
jgi:hypothetical protein